MTKLAIMPVPTEKGNVSYRGVSGAARSQGHTVGEAINALAMQLPDVDAGMLVVVQGLRPDRFFNSLQQQRLTELMDQWRVATSARILLSADEQSELNNL